MKRYLTSVLLILVMACLCFSCGRSEDSSRQGQVIAGEIEGPTQIMRNDLSRKFGWDGSVWIKPIGAKYGLQLKGRDASVNYELPKNGMLEKRLEKVGDGNIFTGKNIQIGNLVFEGNFKWNDEKIMIEKGAKMRKVAGVKIK
jgi:hypothetical protein